MNVQTEIKQKIINTRKLILEHIIFLHSYRKSLIRFPPQKNININIEDFEDIEIPHDTKWTEESIFNVLENAVKYSSENKDINVQVSETINFIRIDIKDNGIGIDKSEYNNIFKRFYRSEKVDDIEGSGIGLYLSRKILEKQGGNIIVSSQKEQGSKFSLFLTKV